MYSKQGGIMKKYEKKETKRLNVNISSELHFEIKKRALFRGINLSEWVIMALIERINEERKRE